MNSPQLSVITLLPDGYGSRREAIAALARQTIRAEIELVLVAPQNSAPELDTAQLASFGSYQVVKVPEISSPGQGAAAGIRAAHARIVAYLEEHSFPEPTWAEALVRAHQAPYAAVGCAMENANPNTLCSWMNMYEEFGPIVAPAASRVTTYLGGHHTTYKREILLPYQDELGRLMNNETALHIDLRARGYQLYLEGQAISRHINFSDAWSYFRQDFLGQRAFAALRAQMGNWSRAQRALFVCAAPLIPFVRLRRVLSEITRTERSGQFLPRGLMYLFPGLCIGTLGEIIGYIFGDSPQNTRLKMQAELHRADFLAANER